MFGHRLTFFVKLKYRLWVYLPILFVTVMPLTTSAQVCESLFATKLYDPTSTSSLVKVLLEGELENLKKADPKTTHLEFFDDYLLESIRRLELEKKTLSNVSTKREIDFLLSAVRSRMNTQRVTYSWILEFSASYAYLFSGGKNAHEFLEISKEHQIIMDYRAQALRWWASGFVVIPTFAKQGFQSYFPLEERGVALLGVREQSEFVDGRYSTPIQNLIHEWGHAEVIQYSRLPKTYIDDWTLLNSKISSKIARLKPKERKPTEAFYFFIVHEQPFLREKILFPIIGRPNQKASNFFESTFRYGIETDPKSTTESGYEIGETFYTRIKNTKDMGISFENEDPKSVVSQAKKNFVAILKEIENDR